MRTLSQRAGLAIRQAVKMISMAGKELVPFFSCRGMRALSGSLARKTPMCEDLWCNIATVLYFLHDTGHTKKARLMDRAKAPKVTHKRNHKHPQGSISLWALLN